MKNLPVLEGKNIYLRALSPNDAKGSYPHWLNDPEVTKYNSHGDVLYTQQMALDYIDMAANSPTHCVFAIIRKSTQQHLGNISLQAIDLNLRSAEFAILIGEPSVYGKGIGYEAGKLLLDYGFETLSLSHIYCGTSENNAAMQRLALKLGMKEKNRRKDALLKKNILFDIIEYSISK